MKIAIVSLGRSHLINLARLLDQRPDVNVTFYTMMPKSRCKKFGYKGKVVSLLFPIGVSQMIVDRLPKVNPYKKSTLRFRLRKAFDKLVAKLLHKCDVLIGLNGCAVEASNKARMMGAIAICDQGSSHILKQNTIHYLYSDAPISEEGTQFMLEHYKAVDYFMTPAEYVKQSDIENGLEPSKILYNPYGVNLDVFLPTLKPTDAPYDVIMVGSWWKHKACDMLAEACLDRLKVSLLHVGSVVDCKLPTSELFTHIGFVNECELPKYYALAKVFAMPSLDEGYGLVFLQAAACGLPLVGSYRTGTPDTRALLGNAKECITIKEPLSVDTIAEAIQQALDIANAMPKGLRTPYGDNIRNISWEAYGNRWYEILKQLTK